MSETTEKISENEIRLRPRGSRERQVHNELERRRKDKINGWITKIGELLPCKEIHKQSKISILEQTVEYIKLLSSEKDELLSNNYSEVIANEIKKLKKEIAFLSEENVLYKKLLQKSNITLSSQPQKQLKYSNKFIHANGVLTVKKSEKTKSCLDKAIQVNMCNNVLSSKNAENNASSSKVIKKLCINDNPKEKSVSRSNVVPKAKIVSVTSVSSVVKSPTPVKCIQTTSIPCSNAVTKSSQLSKTVSEENSIPVISCFDSAQQSSLQTGGVTTVLPHFPVMSTSHGSNFSTLCNKTVPTIIIPSGGSILQQLIPERSSNTISVLCPSTLPILVPQQIFSVTSLARNIGMSSTVICPSQTNADASQVDKSTVGSTLFSINSSSIVPISTSFSAGTQIILPSQHAFMEINSNCPSVTQTAVTPLLTATSQASCDNVSVPLTQDSLGSSPGGNPDSEDGAIAEQSKQTIFLQKEKNILNCQAAKSITSSNGSRILKNNSVPTKHKKSIQDLRSLYTNSPPSLQFLSASKIIALANQSQKGRSKICSDSNQFTKADSDPVNKSLNDSNIIEADLHAKHLELNEYQSVGENVCINEEQSASPSECNKISNPLPKTKFSLTILIEDSSKEHDVNIHKSPRAALSDSPILIASENNHDEPSDKNNASCGLNKETELPCSDEQNELPRRTNEFSNSRDHDESKKMPTLRTLYTTNSQNQSVSLSKHNSSNISTNDTVSLEDLNNLSNANSVLAADSNLSENECIVKNNSSNVNFSHGIKLSNRLQNNHNPSVYSSSLIESEEGVPYSDNGSVSHVLPSLFTSSQLMTLNSQMLVCPTGYENNSTLLLSNTVQTSHDNDNPLGTLHDSNIDFHAYSVDKDTIANASASISQGLVSNMLKKVPDSQSTLPDHTSINIGISDQNKTATKGKTNIEENCNANGNNHTASTKSKVVSKSLKANNVENNNLNCSTNLSSNILSVNHSSDNSQLLDARVSKNNSLIYTDRNDAGNFSFSSDILAKATESIFGNDLLDSPQMQKRHKTNFGEESSNVNVTLTSTENVVESHYKLIKYSYGEENESHSEEPPGESKKRALDDVQHSTMSEIPPTCENEVNLQQHMPKSTKIGKVRKAKAASDCEPVNKKMKDTPSDKSSNLIAVNTSPQLDKEDKSTAAHSHMLFLEKQVSSSIPSADDQNLSLSNFQNQLLLPISNCKTPTSADNIFSLTPMLGDILKDISHNGNFDHRNSNFLLANENQSTFSSEKNLGTHSYSNNSNDDYLNLPRMYFPILPEVSSAPHVHVTNVSFAHSLSLCSTQSDSQKSPEPHASSDLLPKITSKKKDNSNSIQPTQSFACHDLLPSNILSKQSENILKFNSSNAHFNASSPKVLNNESENFRILNAKVNNSSGIFEINPVSQPSSSAQSLCAVPKSNPQYQQKENFLLPVSQHFSFYPTISNSSGIPHLSSSAPALSSSTYGSNLSSSVPLPSTFGLPGINNCSSMPKADNLSHSLCSLLKNSNSENREVSNETSTHSTITTSNSAQSKYSALSLISDQGSFSEPASTPSCHPQFVQTSSGTPLEQFVTTVSSCGRNSKTFLSYSAESLLQTCGNAEKNKNKSNGRCFVQSADKKVRTGISNVHSMNDTNIFMPVCSADVSVQNTALISLPPVTSFHSFPSNYSVCETASSTVFSSVAKIPSSHSNENYVNHMHVNVDSQMLSNRLDINVPSSKPLSNIPIPFENHNGLYNNCNFLHYVKPTLDNSRPSESTACFQPPYNSNFSQQAQKSNCCHFSHHAIPANSELPNDINLPAIASVSSFHSEKNNFTPNRTVVTQSNSNCSNNFFYNKTANCHDGNAKPSSNRSQEIYVPDRVRQNLHDPVNASIIFNGRKAVQSNRTKSKKIKNASLTENNACIINCSIPQDCNKTNLSYIPNGYFKSGSHAPPSQLQCSQNKMSEAVVPPNPSFNPVLHQQSDNFLNINFPNFPMNPLPRPPTQPLSSSCLTTPIISHTFSSSTPHPVPNFNLSNILPDMGCSSNQTFSPPKFPVNNSLTLSSTQTCSNVTNSAHIISHQSCVPSLYPPHPSMVRGPVNPILRHNSQSIIDNHASNVGTATMSQNGTFSAAQNHSFQDTMHPFPHSDRNACEVGKS